MANNTQGTFLLTHNLPVLTSAIGVGGGAFRELPLHAADLFAHLKPRAVDMLITHR